MACLAHHALHALPEGVVKCHHFVHATVWLWWEDGIAEEMSEWHWFWNESGAKSGDNGHG